MPRPSIMPIDRITEAERLIDQARTLLHRPEEEIVVNYLNHAVEALRIVCEEAASLSAPIYAESAFTAPAMAPAEDHG